MKEKPAHYSEKTSHRERSNFWKAIRKLTKQCCQNCPECPLAADIASQNDKVIYQSQNNETNLVR